MGSWPNWEDSLHATVRLVVKINGFYVGDARFQTYRRKYANDGDSTIDSWQLARNAVATPATNYATPRVAKLWESQNLTDFAFDHAREWLSARTAPEAGFSECNDSGVSLSYGPFSYSPSNCTDYDVWTGRIAHHRVYLDQGTWAGTGSRELSYTTGWTMDDAFPSMTLV